MFQTLEFGGVTILDENASAIEIVFEIEEAVFHVVWLIFVIMLVLRTVSRLFTLPKDEIARDMDCVFCNARSLDLLLPQYF